MSKITPKALDDIFDDSVLAALPSNDANKHQLSYIKRAQTKWLETVSKTLKDRWANDPNYVEKILDASSKKWNDPEFVEKIKAITRETFSRPEVIEKRNAILKEVYKSQEWKDAQTEGARKNAKENTDWYEKTVKKNRAIANDPERVRKISESKKRIKEQNPELWQKLCNDASKRNSQKVTTPYGIFPSLKEASNALGIAGNTIRRYVNMGVEGYSMETKNRKTTGKPIITPIGIFVSKSQAGLAYCEFHGNRNGDKFVSNKLKDQPKEYYYISKEEYIMLTGKDL